MAIAKAGIIIGIVVARVKKPCSTCKEQRTPFIARVAKAGIIAKVVFGIVIGILTTGDDSSSSCRSSKIVEIEKIPPLLHQGVIAVDRTPFVDLTNEERKRQKAIAIKEIIFAVIVGRDEIQFLL